MENQISPVGSGRQARDVDRTSEGTENKACPNDMGEDSFFNISFSAKLGDEEITKVSKKANRTKDAAARLKQKYMAKMNAHNQDKKDIDEDFISLTKKAKLQLLVKCCSEGRHEQQDCWS